MPKQTEAQRERTKYELDLLREALFPYAGDGPDTSDGWLRPESRACEPFVVLREHFRTSSDRTGQKIREHSDSAIAREARKIAPIEHQSRVDCEGLRPSAADSGARGEPPQSKAASRQARRR